MGRTWSSAPNDSAGHGMTGNEAAVAIAIDRAPVERVARLSTASVSGEHSFTVRSVSDL